MKIQEELEKWLPKENIKLQEPMKNHTSFKIGGPADYFVKVTQQQEMKNVLNFAKKEQIPVTIIGNGSNLLVKDKGIRGIVVKNEISEIEWQGNKVRVGAGVSLAVLAYEALQKGKTGIEFAAGIPGTIGGAIRMNAGAYGSEIQKVIETTVYLDEKGAEGTLKREEQKFSYRHSIFMEKPWTILQATLELQAGNKEEIKARMEEYKASRKEKQPLEYPSAGSTFKRGDGFITAALLDECGLKGKAVGGAKVSEKHAGFIINIGGATAKDVLELVTKLKEEVKEKRNKKIELEIEVIGEE